ncbi:MULTISPECIES: hypothetical protein [Bradyrhizobium]|jgi:hypothetical protein|nr:MULTISPECIES: hypothetical protein [Bradyrhizobium]UFW46687.1 hypothetical protein BaraCB756_30995 [Bradyrhizobium arachidis]SFU66383.1 hypothetical protein SAMN05192541_103463 [Bradyrhizobium arachidis]
MELEHREDRTDRDAQAAKPSVPNADRTAFTPPFASEGLEQVRDSHC